MGQNPGRGTVQLAGRSLICSGLRGLDLNSGSLLGLGDDPASGLGTSWGSVSLGKSYPLLLLFKIVFEIGLQSPVLGFVLLK